MADFILKSSYLPSGDQPQAIDQLVEGVRKGLPYQTLLGVTGSGKTYTIANVIERTGKPVLIISHNKTLAAQLYGEFKSFFPDNAVEYFVSYYDYYQPEAYIPSKDLYIEKDTSVNDEIDRLRLKATSSLMQRDDVIIIASVSCIYGLGSPGDFKELLLYVEKGQTMDRQAILSRLIDIHYSRNDVDFFRGTFRVRGDVIEIYPAYEEHAIRIELWGDEIEQISQIHPVTGEVLTDLNRVGVYPAKHFVTTPPKLQAAMTSIQDELEEQLKKFRSEEKLLEAQRLESRTLYDLEMLQEIGYCNGIENYSRHISNRKAGERPACLIDYYQGDFLLIIDESHVTVPQIRAMYNGDRARKETLVEFGFRLPSALDNRPLTFGEFEGVIPQTIYVSATPGDFEMERSGGIVVEQLIRPTGLMDPEVIVQPVKGQIDHLISQIRMRVKQSQRVLVTTLTKRMSEELADYLSEIDMRVRYLHSEIDALERVEILRQLRLADFDVLIGVNLLREGLDLPEVSLVAILDADKEGFLRSERSLMQIAGRAARHVEGMVILYADKITDSMQKLIDETKRRREIQSLYNDENRITPKTVYKTVDEILAATAVADSQKPAIVSEKTYQAMDKMEKEELIDQLTRRMEQAAEMLDFERAADLRDEIENLTGKKASRKTQYAIPRRKL